MKIFVLFSGRFCLIFNKINMKYFLIIGIVVAAIGAAIMWLTNYHGTGLSTMAVGAVFCYCWIIADWRKAHCLR